MLHGWILQDSQSESCVCTLEMSSVLSFPPSISCTSTKPTHCSASAPRLSTTYQTNLRYTRQNLKPCFAKLGDRGRAVESKKDDAVSSSGQNGSFLSILCPLLKLFGATDPSAPRNALLEAATSGVSTLARFPWGSKVSPEIGEMARSREQLLRSLQLYEFEACPFCRRVREALTELDLSIEIYPCPKGSLRHRQIVKEIGGKEQFPYLIDPNTDVCLYESGDIVKYLFKVYGGGKEPSTGLLESTIFTGWVPTILRAGRGMSLYQHATVKIPEKKLELFSYENNQFARIVREALCELEMPYVLYNVGFGSMNFSKLKQVQRATQVDIPFLVDPNTGVELGKYQEILSYLFKNYSSCETSSLA